MPRATILDLARADRVLCHGVTGSGKSTAAVRLGRVLGLPVHLADEEIGWLPGWVQRHVDDQRAIARTIAAEPRWVLDSAYGGFRHLVAPRAQVIVVLDYPRWLSLARLLRRTASRIITRAQVCNGNTESLRQVFSADSIVRWHFTSFAKKRCEAAAWEEAHDGPRVLRVRHPRDLDSAIGALERMARR